MVQNIDSILARGERIEVLVDKTDTMAHQAHAFRRGARGPSILLAVQATSGRLTCFLT